MDKKSFSYFSSEWFTPEEFRFRLKQRVAQRQSFYQIINWYVRERGVNEKSNKKFISATRLSSTICSRIKNDPTYRPSIETILALSIGLKIPVDEIKTLLLLKKYALSPEDPAHCAYMDLLRVYDIFEISVQEFNETLEAWGFSEDYFIGSFGIDEKLG